MNGERKIIMAKYRKLGRTSAQRKALLRNQVTAVINNGKIVTTEAKAKEVQKTRQNICTEKGIIKKSGNCSDQQRQDRYHRS